MKVGVLALQGDVPEHVRALAGLLPPDAIVAVTRPAELLGIEALFLPGGESTTIGRLLHESGLDEAIRTRLHAGFPVLATCAGLILLAREIDPTPGGAPETLGILDVT
ncbi:MAG TPA: pyridoxal 5'-phosphate synthase glutaminase subunit PdxT, partial [Thermoplasmata archaeon]|nr:pyridoxal 5'-phosphate synthase glutaminase subunit PdxT [Thermoplasmata archaeon]